MIAKEIIRQMLAGDLNLQLPLPVTADVNATDEFGRTPLMVAALLGRKDFCTYLMANGAIVDARGKYQMTALHEASANGQLEIVKLLLAAGANINATSSDGLTPLMCASAWGYSSLAQLLLSAGADPLAKDTRGATAYDIALEKGEMEVVAMFDRIGIERS